MNGSSYGTSNTGKWSDAASSTSAGGSVSWSKPVPNPRPARWCPASSRTNSRWRLSVSSWIPVVSRSSPPDSHGVGSGSSVMWTQRTGASAASSPVVSSSPISDASPRTVSMGSVAHDPVPGLGEHLAQDPVDDLELLAVRDERRRQLDDGVAAVVRAADQPVLEELARHEAAEQLLALLVGEALLRLLVLDQLERLEVARPAHVADDREVLLQLVEHPAELALLGEDVAAQILALEHVQVRERDGGRDGVAAERDAVREVVLAVHERLGHAVRGDDGAHRRV